jgi:hypothetical protein
MATSKNVLDRIFIQTSDGLPIDGYYQTFYFIFIQVN